MYLGEIGCHPSCKFCKDSDPEYWYVWADEYPFLHNYSNKCYKDNARDVIMNKKVTFNSTDYTQKLSLNVCEDGYYREG